MYILSIFDKSETACISQITIYRSDLATEDTMNGFGYHIPTATIEQKQVDMIWLSVPFSSLITVNNEELSCSPLQTTQFRLEASFGGQKWRFKAKNEFFKLLVGISMG